MLERIYARVTKWLARHGMLRNPDDANASNAPPERSSAEALTTAGMQRGSLLTVRESGDGAGQDDPVIAPPPPPRVTDAVTHERFNLHASVHLDAHDDLRRERLCRYLNRPAFSLERLRVLEGELCASSSRLDWRTLLKRTFEVDLRVWVGCGGKLAVRAVLSEPAVIAKMLDALRRPRAPPAAA